MYKVAIIGAGRRIAPLVKRILQNEDFTLCAICDTDIETAKKRFEEVDDVAYYEDAENMLKSEQPDCVFIGTRCRMHAHFAVLVAKYNIPMFLEKPVAVTQADVDMLDTILHMNEKTVVSFPLRLSAITERAKEIIDEVHANGHIVNCWTVDDKEAAEQLADWGVDQITTNILE